MISKEENKLGNTILNNETSTIVILTSLMIFAEILFLVVLVDPHLFMTINANGSFNSQSYNLFAPSADLILLVATLSFILASASICQFTGAIFGSFCGAVTVMFGISLLLFQITPLSIGISAVNITVGAVIFLVARNR